MADEINSPPHYSQGDVECIEALEAIGIAEDYCRGNAIKYLWRLRAKGEALADVRKALWYVTRLAGYVEAEDAERKEIKQLLKDIYDPPRCATSSTIYPGHAELDDAERNGPQPPRPDQAGVGDVPKEPPCVGPGLQLPCCGGDCHSAHENDCEAVAR